MRAATHSSAAPAQPELQSKPWQGSRITGQRSATALTPNACASKSRDEFCLALQQARRSLCVLFRVVWLRGRKQRQSASLKTNRRAGPGWRSGTVRGAVSVARRWKSFHRRPGSPLVHQCPLTMAHCQKSRLTSHVASQWRALDAHGVRAGSIRTGVVAGCGQCSSRCRDSRLVAPCSSRSGLRVRLSKPSVLRASTHAWHMHSYFRKVASSYLRVLCALA